MDQYRRPSRCRAHDYSQLNDQELLSAIEFVENRACCLYDDHAALQQLYSAEAVAMRHQLVERALGRLYANDSRLTADQGRDLGDFVVRRRIDAVQLAFLIRSATNGRTPDVAELTEIEAEVLLLRLRREP